MFFWRLPSVRMCVCACVCVGDFSGSDVKWNEMSFLNWFFCQVIGSDLGSLNQQTKLDLPAENGATTRSSVSFFEMAQFLYILSNRFFFWLLHTQTPIHRHTTYTHTTQNRSLETSPIMVSKFRALSPSLWRWPRIFITLKQWRARAPDFGGTSCVPKRKGRQLWSNICRPAGRGKMEGGRETMTAYTQANIIRRGGIGLV